LILVVRFETSSMSGGKRSLRDVSLGIVIILERETRSTLIPVTFLRGKTSICSELSTIQPKS
jgi:hypothetical protein